MAPVLETPWWSAQLSATQAQLFDVMEINDWQHKAFQHVSPFLLAVRFIVSVSAGVANTTGDQLSKLTSLLMTTLLTCNAILMTATALGRDKENFRRDPKMLQHLITLIYLVVVYCTAMQTYVFVRDEEVFMLAINTVMAVQLNYIFCGLGRVPVWALLLSTLAQVAPHVLLPDVYVHNGTYMLMKVVSSLQNLLFYQVEKACFLDRIINKHRHRPPQGECNYFLEYETFADQRAFSSYCLRRQFTGLCAGVFIRAFAVVIHAYIKLHSINHGVIRYSIDMISASSLNSFRWLFNNTDTADTGYTYESYTSIILWIDRLAGLKTVLFVLGLLVYRDRIMSDHVLCNRLCMIWFLGITAYNMSGEIISFHALCASDLSDADLTGTSANNQVQILSLVVGVSMMQKYVAVMLTHIPFTVVAATMLVSFIPQMVFFMESDSHPQLFAFQLLLIKVKLVPIVVIYVFCTCFDHQLSRCEPIPTKEELKKVMGRHVTGFTRHRVLLIVLTGFAAILNTGMAYIARKPGQLQLWPPGLGELFRP